MGTNTATDTNLIAAAIATITTRTEKPARDLKTGDLIAFAAPTDSGMMTVVTHIETTKRGLIKTIENDQVRLRNPWDIVIVETIAA